MYKYQKGQTVIEAVVALAIIVLVISAITVVMIYGLSNSQFIENQNEANKLAQQGIEFVRNKQKNDLKNFGDLVLDQIGYVRNATYCIDDQTQTLSTCQTPTLIDGKYKRTIGIYQAAPTECNNGTEARLTVTVSWSSAKCKGSDNFCHKSQLISCIPYKYPTSNP